MHRHPRSGSDPHQNFSRNRAGRGYHFSEKLHAVLVGTANADALRGSVFEHGDYTRRRRRGDREGEGDMGWCFCSETEFEPGAGRTDLIPATGARSGARCAKIRDSVTGRDLTDWPFCRFVQRWAQEGGSGLSFVVL